MLNAICTSSIGYNYVVVSPNAHVHSGVVIPHALNLVGCLVHILHFQPSVPVAHCATVPSATSMFSVYFRALLALSVAYNLSLPCSVAHGWDIG